MLTEEQILQAIESEQFNKYENLDRLAFYRGATWANEQNVAELAALRAQNEKLREALNSIANHFDMHGYGIDAWENLTLEMAETARAAISETEKTI